MPDRLQYTKPSDTIIEEVKPSRYVGHEFSLAPDKYSTIITPEMEVSRRRANLLELSRKAQSGQNLYDMGGTPSKDTRTHAQRNEDYWDPIKGAGERQTTDWRNDKHVAQALGKTVGASAALATGAAYTAPVVTTMAGLGTNLMAGAVGTIGYAALEGRAPTIQEQGIGAAMEMGMPMAFKGLGKAWQYGKGSVESAVDGLLPRLDKSRVSPSSVDEVGNIFKGHTSSRDRELVKWFDEQMRFDRLPKTKNKESLEVLEDFKTRIKTPEGRNRMRSLGIDNDESLQSLGIVEDQSTFGYYTGAKNKIVMHPESPMPRTVTRHEIEHGVQNAKKITDINRAGGTDFVQDPEMLKANTEIDELLSGLELRGISNPQRNWDTSKLVNGAPVDIDRYKSAVLDRKNATDYFSTGSDGREKSAFLAEVQQYMMDTGVIPNKGYIEVTPEMVKNTMTDAIFDEKGGGRYLRLFRIMKNSDSNYDLVAKGLNKMLGITAVGAGHKALSDKNNNK